MHDHLGTEIAQHAVHHAGRIAGGPVRRRQRDAGKRIDLTQPRGGGLTSLGNGEQVDVGRHLGRVNVFAAAAIAHGRPAQGEPDQFMVRANLGGGHLRDEAREPRRLTIDGQLENREGGAVLFQQAMSATRQASTSSCAAGAGSDSQTGA